MDDAITGASTEDEDDFSLSNGQKNSEGRWLQSEEILYQCSQVAPEDRFL